MVTIVRTLVPDEVAHSLRAEPFPKRVRKPEDSLTSLSPKPSTPRLLFALRPSNQGSYT